MMIWAGLGRKPQNMMSLLIIPFFFDWGKLIIILFGSLCLKIQKKTH